MVQCAVCLISYDVSARSHREIKSGRVEPRCVIHRRRKRPATIQATMRRYWLDRYTVDEIVALAEPIWPTPRATSRQALVASAERNDGRSLMG